jgi:hypothetical protein
MSYLSDPSNYLIVFNIILYAVGLWFRSQMISLTPANVDVDSGAFANYWPSAQCARWTIQLAATNCFINFLQGVEHLSYVPTFALLSDTLKVRAMRTPCAHHAHTMRTPCTYTIPPSHFRHFRHFRHRTRPFLTAPPPAAS